MKTLKTILLFTMANIALINIAWAEQKIDKTLKANSDGEVIIDTISGDVSIEGWSRNEVKVVGEIEGKQELIFKTSGNETIIEVENAEGSFFGNHGGDVTLTVYVPTASSIRAEGASTDFEVKGVKGGIRAQSMSGDFKVSNIAKKAQIQSMSGDIEIVNSTAKINIETVSGDITTEVSAIEFDISTVSGDIDAKIGKSERIELASVSGEIDIYCTLAKDGRVDIETVSGDVNLNFMNDKVDAHFDLETGPGGEIRNAITAMKADRSFVGSESVRFKSGDGTGSVNIDTMSGTIAVSK